jgi:hypothetical protein
MGMAQETEMNLNTLVMVGLSASLAMGCSESTKDEDDTGMSAVGSDDGLDDGSDDGTADDGTADDGTADDGTADDGTADDGTADDGSADDGSDDGAGDGSDAGAAPDADGGGALDDGDDDGGPSLDEGSSDDDADADADADGADADGATGDDDADADGADADGATGDDDADADGATGDDDADADADDAAVDPETETDIEDVDTEVGDETASTADKSDCSLTQTFDQDGDTVIDEYKTTEWDSDEHVVLEDAQVMTSWMYEDGSDAGPGWYQGVQTNEYDGDCQTLDMYTIVGWLDSDEVEMDFYEEISEMTCDAKGYVATMDYSLYDDWTSVDLIENEYRLENTFTFDSDDNILTQAAEYSVAGAVALTINVVNTFEDGQFDTQSVEYVEADETMDDAYGEDFTYAVDSRDSEGMPTAARWYDARGDVSQNGEWTYDTSGNVLIGRVWLSGSYDYTDTYEYNDDGKTTYYRSQEAVSGFDSLQTWEFDADGNEVAYSIDNEMEEEVYATASGYDATEYTRFMSRVWDLDIDDVDDFEGTIEYDGDTWPWSYTWELNSVATGEMESSEAGEYTCD